MAKKEYHKVANLSTPNLKNQQKSIGASEGGFSARIGKNFSIGKAVGFALTINCDFTPNALIRFPLSKNIFRDILADQLFPFIIIATEMVRIDYLTVCIVGFTISAARNKRI